MTVTSITRSVSHTLDGVTTVFAIPFRWLDDAWIEVERNGVVLSNGVDYTLVGEGEATGSVTLAAAGTGTAPWMASVRPSASGSIVFALFNSMRYASGFNKPWVGSLDEIMFFSEPLTAVQVADLWRLSSLGAAGRLRTTRRRRSLSSAL